MKVLQLADLRMMKLYAMQLAQVSHVSGRLSNDQTREETEERQGKATTQRNA
jgi:hypothetical protein